MDTSYIIQNQNTLNTLFNTKKWNRLNLIERERLLYTVFHRTNWKKLIPNNILPILQELENITAKKENRKPYNVGLQSTKYNDTLDDLILDISDHSILIKPNLIFRGLKIQKDKYINISDRLNCSLLDYFLHEQKHICQITRKKQIIQKMKNNINIPSHSITDEDSEIQLFSITNPQNTNKSNYIRPEDSYLEYSLQPIEYYAFNDSETKVNSIFTNLEMVFGLDTGYKKWKKDKETYKNTLIDIYKNKFNIQTSLTYTQMYKQFIIERAKLIAQWYNMDLADILDFFNISMNSLQDDKSLVV